jgi:uncharacterized protein
MPRHQIKNRETLRLTGGFLCFKLDAFSRVNFHPPSKMGMTCSVGHGRGGGRGLSAFILNVSAFAMVVNLQRPILVGGASLCFLLLMMDALSHLLGELGIFAALAGLVGTGVWWFRRSPTIPLLALPPAREAITSTVVQRTIAEAQQIISQIATEAAAPDLEKLSIPQPNLEFLHLQARQIATGLTRQTLQIALVGATGTGKTTLQQQLQMQWGAIAPPMICAEVASGAVSGLTVTPGVPAAAIAADLVLFLITGDITDSECQELRAIAAQTRTLLVFNKQDQFLPQQRPEILSRIQQQVQAQIQGLDVVAIAAAPPPIRVRQHQADGSQREWLEPQSPDLQGLIQRLQHIAQTETPQLVLASSLQQAVCLKSQAKTTLNDCRRARALPLVEQFQWISAATAFASPLPTVDVIATAAINAQMLLDLGALYRQPFTLSQAQKMVVTLGKMLLQLGLVELSSQAISTLLKTNALTFVAGGCVQGISAAYLTRITGLSLIEYFDTQDPLPLTDASPLALERFSQILQTVFQKHQQLGFLQIFMGQALARLSPPAPPSQLPAPLSQPLVIETAERAIALEPVSPSSH